MNLVKTKFLINLLILKNTNKIFINFFKKFYLLLILIK